MTARDGGVGWLRALNEQAVLEVVVREQRVSRAQIARATGLSKPTVSSVVAALERYELLRRAGPATGTSGRPAVLYEVNSQAGYLLGYDIGGNKIRAGIADLFGEVLGEIVEPTHRATASGLVRQLVSLRDRLVGGAEIDGALLRGAGIGVPGVYDFDSDRVSAAYNVPALAEWELAATLEPTLGVPVRVDNDVNLAALGERWRGLAAACRHFVAISVGTGVGMGIVIDGEIYRGARGAGGEIGFLPLSPGDPFDPSHQTHGPFEDAVSGVGLWQRLAEASREQRAAGLLREAQSVPDIFAAATEGDPAARGLVEEEARLVALGVAAVVAVLDPDMVVLGGGIGANPAMLEPVRRFVRALLPRDVPVERSALGDRAAFYGAIAAGLTVTRRRLLSEVRSGAPATAPAGGGAAMSPATMHRARGARA